MSSMGKLLALSLVCALAAAVLFQPVLMGRPRQSREDAMEPDQAQLSPPLSLLKTYQSPVGLPMKLETDDVEDSWAIGRSQCVRLGLLQTPI